MSNRFSVSRELVDAFRLDQQSEFTEITTFPSNIGFSVQRPYPPTSAFKPPLKKDGSPDTVILVTVEYMPRRSDPKTPALVPILATASVFSRYISRHFDYDFKDADCPTKDSIRDSKKTPRPVDLDAIDQFFYDHNTDTIRDSKGKVIEGIKIVNELYEQHIETVDSLRGRMFRWKKIFIDKALPATNQLDKLLKWFLEHLFGRIIERPKNFEEVLITYSPKDTKSVGKSIKLFGYHASVNVIITFCVVLILFYVILMTQMPQWIVVVENHTPLCLAICIIVIAFLDLLVPWFLLQLINLNIRVIYRLLRKKNIRFR